MQCSIKLSKKIKTRLVRNLEDDNYKQEFVDDILEGAKEENDSNVVHDTEQL